MCVIRFVVDHIYGYHHETNSLNMLKNANTYRVCLLLKLKCGQYPAIHTSYIISQSTTL